MANSKSTSKNRPTGNLIKRQPYQPLTRISRAGGNDAKVGSDQRIAHSLTSPAVGALFLPHGSSTDIGVSPVDAQANGDEFDARMTEIYAAAGEVKFPLCDAAARKMEGGEWELADAIVAECSETGDDGVFFEQVIVRLARNANSARFGYTLKPSGNIHAIAVNIVINDDDVAEVYAKPKFDPLIDTDPNVPLAHAALHFNGTSYRVNHGRELDQHAVSGCLDDTAPMFFDLRIDQRLPMPL